MQFDHTISIDIETYSSVDLKTCGVYKYTEAPDFTVLMFAYSYDNAPVEIVDLTTDELPTWLLAAMKDKRTKKTAHNAAFERTCLAKYLGIEMPPEQWECTMVKAAMLGLPMKLEDVAKVLKLDAQKDKRGKDLINLFSKPQKVKLTKKVLADLPLLVKLFPDQWRTLRLDHGLLTEDCTDLIDGMGWFAEAEEFVALCVEAPVPLIRAMPADYPAEWEEYKAYCVQDVVVERSIAEAISFFTVPPQEQELWRLDQRINDRGVMLDREMIGHAIAIDTENKGYLMQRAREISGIANPKSGQQLMAWLNEEMPDADITTLRKGDVPDLLDEAGDNEAVKQILTIRQELAKTSVTKYNAMLKYMCTDDRARGLLQFYGANRTGRWAGRGIQLQNLPRIDMSSGDLHIARTVAKTGDGAELDMLFGNVANTLSQLIRATFVAAPGKKFIVADFSAIEARVIAWLAGEKWRLDVFNTHGKIYEASASKMFNVPLEEVTKDLRQRGKVAELANGYQGGWRALVAMGILTNPAIAAAVADALIVFTAQYPNLSETKLEEMAQEFVLQPLVDAWRAANPKIKQLWRDVQDAVISAIQEPGKLVQMRYVSFNVRKGFLFATLPSGRVLSYFNPRIKDGKYGPSITYEGVDQTRKIWCTQDTYGGKLVENCLAGDTLVLTDRGWVELRDIKPWDEVWDGECWVNHRGLVNQGTQDTININGVELTTEHEILTTSGWKNASSCERYYGQAVIPPNSYTLCGIRRKKVYLAATVRLWKNNGDARFRVQQRQTDVLRVQEKRIAWGQTKNARIFKAPGLLGMALNARQVQITNAPGLGELRRQGYNRVPGVGRKFRGILGGHGANVCPRAIYRQGGREPGLLPGKLSMGNNESASKEQTLQCVAGYRVGLRNRSRGFRKVGNRRYNAPVSNTTRVASGSFVCTPGRNQPVYDLLNCGARRRFTILMNHGPVIVHNCVQAIARDCLAVAMLRVNKAGYDIAMHVHDEIVCEVPLDFGSLEEVCEIMSQPMPWAPGLPLAADGFEGLYYKK